MYEDKRGKFTLKDIILQLLIVVLFMFLLVWFFPTKGYMNSKIDPILDTIFNTNIMTMKDAAKDYYTLARLPQNVGDKTKMTLGEMIKKKLVLPFKDKYGEECDLDASYVQVTKKDDEYVMKVNLKCSNQEDYIIVHMGCYDYCSTTICEKKDTDTVTSTGKVVPKPKPNPTPTPKPKKYICEYAYNANGYYTPWVIGDWTKDKKPEIAGVFEVNNTKTEVERKEIKVLTGFEYKEFFDGNQPIYTNVNIVTGQTATTTTTCKTVTTYTETVTYSYGGAKYMGLVQSNKALGNSAGVNYELVAATPIMCDVNCTTGISSLFTYKKYANSSLKTYTNKKVDGTYTECTDETTYSPIVESVPVVTGFKKALQRIPIYRIDVYERTITLYQYKSRKWVNGNSDVKWSNCNDTNLLNSGYVLTGNRKEVQ